MRCTSRMGAASKLDNPEYKVEAGILRKVPLFFEVSVPRFTVFLRFITQGLSFLLASQVLPSTTLPF
jgi:hypothetical protein